MQKVVRWCQITKSTNSTFSQWLMIRQQSTPAMASMSSNMFRMRTILTMERPRLCSIWRMKEDIRQTTTATLTTLPSLSSSLGWTPPPLCRPADSRAGSTKYPRCSSSFFTDWRRNPDQVSQTDCGQCSL